MRDMDMQAMEAWAKRSLVWRCDRLRVLEEYTHNGRYFWF